MAAVTPQCEYASASLHELAQHALEGRINVLPSGEAAVTVTGQPNVIAAFDYRCQYAAMGIQHVAISDL